MSLAVQLPRQTMREHDTRNIECDTRYIERERRNFERDTRNVERDTQNTIRENTIRECNPEGSIPY